MRITSRIAILRAQLTTRDDFPCTGVCMCLPPCNTFLLRFSNASFTDQYDDLRSKWQDRADEENVKCVSNMVWKDVLRTDRYKWLLVVISYTFPPLDNLLTSLFYFRIRYIQSVRFIYNCANTL